jgi:phosphoribosylanthranilate isomerase
MRDLDRRCARRRLDGGALYWSGIARARNVDLATARSRLAPVATRSVAVVDADDTAIREINDTVAPDIFQLHGKESPERVAQVAHLTGRPIIKAIPVASEDDTVRAETYGTVAHLILFDAKPPTHPDALPGGNGLVFDWSLIASVSSRVPYMLSGGLTPDNVADAIRQTAAKMVDVSSGVESAPGVKDPELIRRFLAAVKTVKHTS